jgi:hypothetical protein
LVKQKNPGADIFSPPPLNQARHRPVELDLAPRAGLTGAEERLCRPSADDVLPRLGQRCGLAHRVWFLRRQLPRAFQAGKLGAAHFGAFRDDASMQSRNPLFEHVATASILCHVSHSSGSEKFEFGAAKYYRTDRRNYYSCGHNKRPCPFNPGGGSG